MLQASLLPLGNQEILTDCVYDFYGLRLAASGVDSKIKIFRLNESTGEWAFEHEWKAHDAPITKLSWAHPEHGSVIASASFDRTVKIWQENPGQSTSSQSRWTEKAIMTGARGSVRSIEFAPSVFGLKIASIATDSLLRVYECLEIYSASSWQLIEEIDVLTLGNPPNPPSPALASATPTHLPMNLEEGSPPYASSIHRPSTPTTLSSPIGSLSAPGGIAGSNREADSGWCLSWCKDKWQGEAIAVGAGPEAVIKIVSLPPAPQSPILLATLKHTSSDLRDKDYPVSCVSWAPTAGRSYHLIATGSKDTYVRIWKVSSKLNANGQLASSGDETSEEWEVRQVGEFEDHKSNVARLEWNITGTVLSSAGDDGQIRLWKSISNIWQRIGSFNTHHAVEEVLDNQDDVMQSI
ncbi:WD40-repeat-containing domain protein [Cantharellus anzutake]|uniref:WD40-repeat-containing domain protein n=1 Tax=Cantharellus anzutake TaxID=1750568 RepID=UPI00190835B6|nr:WD40-repeat-containing domain protein [Cantharellus anzutake]KAF8324257.1 WD40-repeat-containing domain protein [Cantharellus anzutake]